MSNYEQPWQESPSRLISHAIDLANKNTEFDNLMAFLIVDVGVETLLKVYLEQDAPKELEKAKQKKSQNGGRELNFHDIIELVKELSGQKLDIVKIDNASYFHKKRNKKYHDGNDSPPYRTDLDGYIILAKTLLKALLQVDIDKFRESEKTKEPEKAKDSDQSYYSAEGIRQNILSLQSNSAIMVEHLYPQIGSRKFEAQLRNIRTITGPNDESYQPLAQEELDKQELRNLIRLRNGNLSMMNLI